MVKNSVLLKATQRSLLNRSLQPQERQWLEQFELADVERATAFGVTSANVQQVIEQRADELRTSYPTLQQWCSRLGNSTHYLSTLWTLWLPLAQELADRRSLMTRPLVQGILGGQGTGKTTLAAVLSLILRQMGYTVLSWSLDDLYKTHADRRLLQQHDPRLLWRGPPGTHDIELGIQVLDQLRQPTPNRLIAIPRFDKSLHGGSGDRTAPELVQNIDIILFEGWFAGVHPVAAAAFDQPPPPIDTTDDRAFAQDINIRLSDYLPLWERLDRLWVLQPVDYRLSRGWRKQAEHEMKAAGKEGMSDAAIDAFVHYFWKALHPELFLPPTLQRADLVIEVNADRSIKRVAKRG